MDNPLVQPDPGLFIWTILTFLVLVALLARFAWRPLLQALELTNGTTLDNYLKGAAIHWQQKQQNSDVMISKVYLTALGREPNRAERTIASETLDEQPTPETIADLLWITVMLPEFQLIQ